MLAGALWLWVMLSGNKKGLLARMKVIGLTSSIIKLGSIFW
jgi:hypothetical protein